MILAGILAIVALGFLITAPVLLIQAARTMRSHQSSAENAAAHHAGDLVGDGSVDFTVTSARCGLSTVGHTLTPKNGQFCLVRVTAHNRGTAPVTLAETAQRAFGSRGAFYFPDRAADTVLDGDKGAITPGSSRNTTYVYDIPGAVTLTGIELHSGTYSEGVDVRI